MMIRGVNRQVIEVKKTGSIYFERALLVVNPFFSDTGKDVLDDEARDVMEKLGRTSASEEKIRLIKKWSALLAAAAVGALIATLILLLS